MYIQDNGISLASKLTLSRGYHISVYSLVCHIYMGRSKSYLPQTEKKIYC